MRALVVPMCAVLLCFVQPALGADPIRAEGAWVRTTPPGVETTAFYVTLRNTGAQDDRVVAASSSVAGVAELHEVVRRGDLMEMQPREGGYPLPARGTTVLEPGGFHIMLIGLKQPVQEGAAVPITLRFEHAPPLTIRAPAMLAAGMGALEQGGMSHGSMGQGSMAPGKSKRGKE